MKKFEQKRQFRRRLYSKTVLIILLLILIFLIRGTWEIWQKSRQSEDNLKVVQLELEKLKEREVSIEKKIQRLSTETGLEEEIRSKFDVAREGENLIVIVDDELPVVIEEDQNVIENILTTIKSWFQ